MDISTTLKFTVSEVVALIHLHKADTTSFIILQFHSFHFISLQFFIFADEEVIYLIIYIGKSAIGLV